MAFVHVEYGRAQSDLLERAQPSDAERDLLANALIKISAVELAGDVAVNRVRILRNVAVQKIKLHSPYVDPPNLQINRVAGHRNIHQKLAAVRARHRRQGERVEIVQRRLLQLPAVGSEGLYEIALLIQQSDPHQG